MWQCCECMGSWMGGGGGVGWTLWCNTKLNGHNYAVFFFAGKRQNWLLCVKRLHGHKFKNRTPITTCSTWQKIVNALTLVEHGNVKTAIQECPYLEQVSTVLSTTITDTMYDGLSKDYRTSLHVLFVQWSPVPSGSYLTSWNWKFCFSGYVWCFSHWPCE